MAYILVLCVCLCLCVGRGESIDKQRRKIRINLNVRRTIYLKRKLYAIKAIDYTKNKTAIVNRATMMYKRHRLLESHIEDPSLVPFYGILPLRGQYI